MKEKKNKKLIIGSGLFILLISATGGGIYFAEQKQPIEQEAKLDIEQQEHPAESYIQSVYTTYSSEIVSTWNDLSNDNPIDFQVAQNHVIAWNSMMAKQNNEYNSLNLPIKEQISIIEEFIAVSQENVSAEQRKKLRELSARFVEGHESVNEGLLKVLEVNKAKYSVEEDGTINYQF